ncbi:MAG: flavin reductase family protein [Bacteroidales bacterium]|nr:flavin reductase family protein [Bacteroidales bacterium]
MKKRSLHPGTWLFPLPVALVSCGNMNTYNIITISWTGTICSDPPMCYISVRPERYSHQLLMDNPEFVINLANAPLTFASDWCGVKSGRDVNKFKDLKLTPMKAETLNCPIILESPINIECKITEVKKLGSHDMFIAKVTNVQVSDNLFADGAVVPNLKNAELISYLKTVYLSQGEQLGRSGFSIKK